LTNKSIKDDTINCYNQSMLENISSPLNDSIKAMNLRNQAMIENALGPLYESINAINLRNQAMMENLLGPLYESINAMNLRNQAIMEDTLGPLYESVNAMNLRYKSMLDDVLSPLNNSINSAISMKLKNTINSFNQIISYNTNQSEIDIDASDFTESIENINEYIECELEDTSIFTNYKNSVINNASAESSIKKINYNELITLICLVITTILMIIQHFDNSNNEKLIESLNKIDNTLNLMIESEE